MTDSPWQRLQQALKRELDGEEYATWFAPLRSRSEPPGSGRLVLVAPSPRFLHTLEESHRPTLERVAHQLFGDSIAVELIGEDAPAVALPPPVSPSGSLDRLNPRYLFSSFVVGGSNQFAHAAARAVAESPSHSYNPLFLYGGVGLGKTHLLHAIGNEILRRNPELKVLYVVAEKFLNELINAIRFDRQEDFRARYRTIDVLLLDDVQFIAGKESTQQEFFHTFNTLYNAQRQIILSSDSSPRNIPMLEERLRSRFEWGLIADIQPPDLETKIAILRRKADAINLQLPDDVALFLARQVKSNVRELEGLLNRVLAFSSLTGKPLSLELASETLRDILPHDGRRVTGADIIKSVARHYGLTVTEIKSRTNARQIAFPRQVAMYLCKQLTELSYPEIGRLFNDKHHSTVMYSVEKIDELRGKDQDLDRALNNLRQHFN
jgi:chromosomal replication initiator protein